MLFLSVIYNNIFKDKTIKNIRQLKNSLIQKLIILKKD